MEGCGCGNSAQSAKQVQAAFDLIDEKCLDDLTAGLMEDAAELGKQALAKGTARVQAFLACNFGLSTQAASKAAKMCFFQLALCAVTKRDPVICGTQLITCLGASLIGGGSGGGSDASAETPNLQAVARC